MQEADKRKARTILCPPHLAWRTEDYSVEGGSGCLHNDRLAAACNVGRVSEQQWEGHFVIHTYIHFAIKRRGNVVQEAQGGITR